MENIKTIYLDFDSTIVNTNKAIVDLYDEDFKYYTKYKQVKWEDVLSWDFTELEAATPDYINYYFNQQRFFDKLEMFPYAKDTIDYFAQYYQIVIVSHGYSPNLRGKEIYCRKHFPYAKFIGVNLKSHADKSHIDMSNGIFIDDRLQNLESSNASVKICYGDYNWNEYKNDWVDDSSNHYIVSNWLGLKYLIGYIINK